MDTQLTPASLDLFTSFVEDAPNWSGMPLYQGGQRENGNLADLKKKGLIETSVDEDPCRVHADVFVTFTDLGIQLAADLGFDTTYLA